MGDGIDDELNQRQCRIVPAKHDFGLQLFVILQSGISHSNTRQHFMW